MRSRNASGTGTASLEQAFVVGAAGCSGPPAGPLDLRATVKGSSVTLAWLAPPQSIATTYRVMAGSASGVANIGTFDVGGVTTYTTAAPAGAYFVRVQAANACGVGLESVVIGSTVSLAWGAPSAGSEIVVLVQ